MMEGVDVDVEGMGIAPDSVFWNFSGLVGVSGSGSDCVDVVVVVVVVGGLVELVEMVVVVVVVESDWERKCASSGLNGVDADVDVVDDGSSG